MDISIVCDVLQGEGSSNAYPGLSIVDVQCLYH